MKAFLFDMDGVIVDTEDIHREAEKKILARYGVAATDPELSGYAGTSDLYMYEDIGQKHGVKLPLLEVRQLKDQLFREIIASRDLKPIAGIPKLLAALKALPVRLAIASSSDDDFINYIVDRLQIRSYFDALISGRNLPVSKPDPAIYLLAARTLGLPPSDCVVLEDADSGIQAAKTAGMFCIGYRNPITGCQSLSQADLVVDRIEDIEVQKL
jgi:beta-phosphoglucomutase